MASRITIAMRSKMRQWRRLERRWESILVMGPVVPAGLLAVVSGVSVVSISGTVL